MTLLQTLSHRKTQNIFKTTIQPSGCLTIGVLNNWPWWNYCPLVVFWVLKSLREFAVSFCHTAQMCWEAVAGTILSFFPVTPELSEEILPHLLWSGSTKVYGAAAEVLMTPSSGVKFNQTCPKKAKKRWRHTVLNTTDVSQRAESTCLLGFKVSQPNGKQIHGCRFGRRNFLPVAFEGNSYGWWCLVPFCFDCLVVAIGWFLWGSSYAPTHVGGTQPTCDSVGEVALCSLQDESF